MGITEIIKSEIEKELTRLGRGDSREINVFAFNRYYDNGEISEFLQGNIKVRGMNCYFKTGVLDGKNIYSGYIPTNPDGSLNLDSLKGNPIQQLNVEVNT